jgi:hypothetical protein
MATEKQKQAARRNLTKARAAQSARAKGKRVPRRTQGLSTHTSSCSVADSPQDRTHHLHRRMTRQRGGDATTH